MIDSPLSESIQTTTTTKMFLFKSSIKRNRRKPIKFLLISSSSSYYNFLIMLIFLLKFNHVQSLQVTYNLSYNNLQDSSASSSTNDDNSEKWHDSNIIHPSLIALPSLLMQLNDDNLTDIFLPRPENISVVLTQYYPPEVRIHWSYDRRALKNCRLRSFQIIYHPTRSRYRISQEVPPFFKNLTLNRLQPGIEYSLIINALSESGHYNSSKLTNFVSPDNETRRSHRKFINREIQYDPNELNQGSMVREDEVVIVCLVIAAWIGCIFIFFNKWGKIRMLEPYQPQYKESFPNSMHSIHPKTSRMNTCTSVPPNMISLESRGSLIIPERDLLFHHRSMMDGCGMSGGPGGAGGGMMGMMGAAMSVGGNFGGMGGGGRYNESNQLYQCASGTTYHHPAYRPRLNSVFVGNPYHRNSLYPDPCQMPRKVKSAEDLKSLVVQVQNNNNNVPSTSTSVL